MIVGHEEATRQFLAAHDRGSLHHAWLLAGPRGVGKATFARIAATRLLANAAGPKVEASGLETPGGHPIARLVAAGSHPDLRVLERLEKKERGLARNISVDQVRSLAELLDLTPSLSPWRCVIIDSADDLEASGANALLKMLEEPPANCVFFLVAHAPGRLLPTIRSRCRRLDFRPLDNAAMTSILQRVAPDLPSTDRESLLALSAGSAGRAVAIAALDLGKIEQAATTILREGDPTNGRRSALALELGRKGAADRYSAFLDMVPGLVAREARTLSGPALERALDAYSRTRELAALAPRLSLDPAATAFQLGGILASVAPTAVP